jgi:hypothetical protein
MFAVYIGDIAATAIKAEALDRRFSEYGCELICSGNGVQRIGIKRL